MYRKVPSRYRGQLWVGYCSNHTRANDRSGWSAPRPGHFTPGKVVQCPWCRRL